MNPYYEYTQPYNDMMDRQDKQDQIDRWVEENWNDYKDDFAVERMTQDREIERLVTATRPDAERKWLELRAQFARDYDQYLCKKANEELFGEDVEC